jgi:hypothetical protein
MESRDSFLEYALHFPGSPLGEAEKVVLSSLRTFSPLSSRSSHPPRKGGMYAQASQLFP